VESALISADRRTDMAKLIGAFRDCVNAPKLHAEYIHVFCTIISQVTLFPSTKLISFCNRDGMCLLRGTFYIIQVKCSLQRVSMCPPCFHRNKGGVMLLCSG
jgi:hypothetical protein